MNLKSGPSRVNAAAVVSSFMFEAGTIGASASISTSDRPVRRSTSKTEARVSPIEAPVRICCTSFWIPARAGTADPFANRKINPNPTPASRAHKTLPIKERGSIEFIDSWVIKRLDRVGQNLASLRRNTGSSRYPHAVEPFCTQTINFQAYI
ncbi:MAG: hypothetical protein AAGL98_01655 [Planctomycetota bacterium]